MLHASLLTALAITAASPLEPGDHELALEHGGRTRDCLMHVPRSYDGRKAVPLVLVLHPATVNARVMMGVTGLNGKSEEEGFIAVYPNGTGRRPRILFWNAGDCCAAAGRNQVDDVGFLEAVIETVSARARIDGNRVYVVGMSNGGMMAYRLAMECSERIAAVASVAGSLQYDGEKPKRAVPVLHFHGTDDESVPFAGGRSPDLPLYDFRSVARTVNAWVGYNDCAREPRRTELADAADDGTVVRREHYRPKRNGAEVVLYVIEGGGHTWPGRPLPRRLYGRTTFDVSANDVIWDFFERNPLGKSKVRIADPPR